MSTIVVLALMLSPIAALLLLRANAALVFMALCLGFTVTHYVSAHEISTQLAPYIGPARDNHIQLLFAFLPAVVALLCTLSSQAKGLQGIVLNAFPAIGVGFLTIALTLPFLAGELRGDIIESSLWINALKLQAPIIGFAALASLLVLVNKRSGPSPFDK